MKRAFLAAAMLCAAGLLTCPAFASLHPLGPPPATELFGKRQFHLPLRLEFAVLLRRESATNAGQRPTLRVIVRAPNSRVARLIAEAEQPGYSAIEAVRVTEQGRAIEAMASE